MKLRAFTMIELVFVIVLLGVIGMIASDITVNMYGGYNRQKQLQEAEYNAKFVLEFIDARLRRSIFASIADKDGNGIANVARGSSTVIKWIDKDIEGLRGIWNGSFVQPAYSGFAKLDSSSGTEINTSDCNLSKLNSHDALSDSNSTALYFAYAESNGTVGERFWNNPSSLFKVDSIDAANEKIILKTKPSQISENYYLTYTANAIDFNGSALLFHDNFQPWDNENYGSVTPNTLADNISSFEFWGESDGMIVRFRVCSKASDVEICKESAVIQ